MLAAIAFLALLVVIGHGPVSRLGALAPEVRGCLAFVLGLLVAGPAVFITAQLAGGLSSWHSLGIALVLALLSLRMSIPSEEATSLPISYRASLFIVLAPLYILSSRVFLAAGPRGLYSAHPVWGDLPIHLAFITSFVHGSNFPPVYPILPSIPAHYPFMIDFVSAVLVDLGAGLRESILVPNVLLYACLATLAYGLVREVGEDPDAADLAPIILFFGGGLQFLHAIAQRTLSDSAFADAGYHLHNTTWAFLLPQRTTLVGLCSFAAILLLLARASARSGRDRSNHLVVAGLATGLLPLYHAHSFLSACVVAGGFALLTIRQWGRRDIFLFLMPGAILAIPAVLWMSGQFGSEGFIRQAWWWMVDEGATASDVILFWAKNLGFILLLYLIGLRAVPRRALLLAVAALPLFIIPNIVILQPWEWDNSKMVLCWLVGSLPVLCAGAVRALRWSPLGALLLLPVLASSVLYLGPMALSSHVLFSNDAIEVAAWVRENTAPTAVFLADPGLDGDTHHNNAVISLAGRRTYIGFNGWLSSHGLDYRAAWDDTRSMLRGACERLSHNGIEYVYLRPGDGPPAPVFQEVYSVNGYRVYRVSCP